jgi:hypothetical protein
MAQEQFVQFRCDSVIDPLSLDKGKRREKSSLSSNARVSILRHHSEFVAILRNRRKPSWESTKRS